MTEMQSTPTFEVGLAHEIHDALGLPLITAREQMRALLEALRAESFERADGVRVCERALASLDEAYSVARRIEDKVYPVLLANGMFLAAIEELARRTEVPGREVHCVRAPGMEEPALSVDEGLHLYRIVQESITNGLKYGKEFVLIHCSMKGKDLQIRIEDDGPGLAGMGDAPAKSKGLDGMKLRADRIGAQLTFERSALLGGAAVVVRHPLP